MSFITNVCLFQAEPDTDEVFAQVTLLPEPNVSSQLVGLFIICFFLGGELMDGSNNCAKT